MLGRLELPCQGMRRTVRAYWLSTAPSAQHSWPCPRIAHQCPRSCLLQRALLAERQCNNKCQGQSPVRCTSAAAASFCSQSPAATTLHALQACCRYSQDSCGAERSRRLTSTDVQSMITSSSEAPPARALQLRSALSRMQWEGQPCPHGCQAGWTCRLAATTLPRGTSSLTKQPGRSPRQPLLQAYRLRQVMSASSGCPAGTVGKSWR